jgi:cell division protein FtsW (lipid II flippase)
MRWLRAIGWTVAGVAGAAFLLAYVNDADLRAALYWPLLVGVLALLVFETIERGSRRRSRRIADLEGRVATLEGKAGHAD